MDNAFIVSILIITIRAGTSLLYATLGEIFTERAGILNLEVEGIMIMGAATSFSTAYYKNNPWLGLIAAIIVCGFLGLIHAFLTITLRADQVVSGLAMTIFGTGLASFMGQRLGPRGTTLIGLQGPSFDRFPFPLLHQLPIIGPSFFNQDILVYILYLIIPLLWFLLYKTLPGLKLRAVGENPRASDSVGIDVVKSRYFYAILGAALISIAGSHLSLGYLQDWA